MKKDKIKKPKLTDFYNELDPRGCSSSEYNDYLEALRKYKHQKSTKKK